jgi:hypothetical protein
MNTLNKGWRHKISQIAVIMLLIALLVPSSVSAAAETFTVSSSFPIDFLVFIPCAAGGVGELVELTGDLHDLFHVTFTSSGTFRMTFSDNPQGISGTGWTTGDKYQGTGITRDTFGGRVGYEETFVNNFRIIGQGTGNNFLIHENLHITVNANGTMTVFHDNFSVVCK